MTIKQIQKILLKSIKNVKSVKAVSTKGKVKSYQVTCNKGCDIRGELSSTLCENNMPVIMIKQREKGLEEIFINLTEGEA